MQTTTEDSPEFSPEEPTTTTLITGASILDGTGQPAFFGNLRITGDRIAAIGDLQPLVGEHIINGAGLLLTPGFIDSHSHADTGLDELPEALAAVSQGVTTVVVGQDGFSPFPLGDYLHRLEESPKAVNVASYAGHGTLRQAVMGDRFQRRAEPREIDRMESLLRRELEAGALGLSSGLEYEPGLYSDTEELIRLAQATAESGGRYISHLRSEDRHLWQAVEEALDIARQAQIPVQISHLKIALRSDWGQATQLLGMLDQARAQGLLITADLYPYTFWQSSINVLFENRVYDRSTATFALDKIVRPEDLLIPHFLPEPDLQGKTLAQISNERMSDPVTTLLQLARQANRMRAEKNEDPDTTIESVIATSMDEGDVEQIMAWPYANFCTDGGLRDSHPRAFGSFTRILGRYVRQKGVLTWPQAIHKMTGLAAENLGFEKRGVLRPGFYADLVLLDPDRVIDRATTEQPEALSDGIHRVWVSGQIVYDHQKTTGRLPGRVIRGCRKENRAL